MASSRLKHTGGKTPLQSDFRVRCNRGEPSSKVDFLFFTNILGCNCNLNLVQNHFQFCKPCIFFTNLTQIIPNPLSLISLERTS